MNNLRVYIKESFDELVHHVTWPTWPELYDATKLVLISAIIFALVTLVMDTIANTVLTNIYSL